MAKINELRLLPRLAHEVLIPTEVHRELLGKAGAGAGEIRDALDSFIAVRQPPEGANIAEELRRLDEGERQVILLANSMTGSPWVLLDDKAGREAARRFDLSYTGTAGLLVVGKQKGLIPHVIPFLENMRNQGYWLSEAVIEAVRRLAKEE